MKYRILATIWIALLAAPAAAQVRDGRTTPLAAARELYASARYDEALAVLNELRTDGATATDRRSIAQYRSLCLLALGRGTEAEEAIAVVVTSDPHFRPNESDAAPRVRAAFSDVRQRLLPEIAAARYGEAKRTYDGKNYAAAERQFRDLLSLLNDPQMGGRQADLKVLTTGFLELSARAAAPPPAPAPDPQPKRQQAAAVPVVAAADTRRIYVAEDAGVTPPVALKQELPRVPSGIMSQIRGNGLLEIVIDELGRVTFMALRTPVHVQYDPMLLAAAKDWRYQPATFGGVPVKFRKMIRIVNQR